MKHPMGKHAKHHKHSKAPMSSADAYARHEAASTMRECSVCFLSTAGNEAVCAKCGDTVCAACMKPDGVCRGCAYADK